MSAPFFYDHINTVNSLIDPSTVHSQNAILTRYFRRYLLQRAISVFKFELPSWWVRSYVLYCIFMLGHVAVFETDAFGVIPQDSGLEGHGVQYEPTHATISNPLLRGLIRPRIGEDCEIIRLMPDWGGLYDIVCEYAEALALASEAVSFNLINSKHAFVYAAQSKAAAETFKKMYDRVSHGDPAVFVDKELFDEDGNLRMTTFAQDLRANFIAPELIEARRRILCNFDNAVGIDANLAFNKKERINTAEVTANNNETFLNAAIWLDCLKEGCEKVNDMFGLSLSVDWRIRPGERGNDNANVSADTVQ